MGCAGLVVCQAGYLSVPLGSMDNLQHTHLKHGMNPGYQAPKPLGSRITAVLFQGCRHPRLEKADPSKYLLNFTTGAGHREKPTLGPGLWRGAASPGGTDLEEGTWNCSHVTDGTPPVIS